MTDKEELREIVERLDENLPAMWLDFLRTGDPALRAHLLAPMDDEPTTPEEDASADEAWAEYRRGELVSPDETKARLLS